MRHNPYRRPATPQSRRHAKRRQAYTTSGLSRQTIAWLKMALNELEKNGYYGFIEASALVGDALSDLNDFEIPAASEIMGISEEAEQVAFQLLSVLRDAEGLMERFESKLRSTIWKWT